MEHLLVSCIESRIENNRNLYSCFQIGPFDKGRGLTVANAMRRTLLSELSSLAIVCVEIQGISHEYSSIKGVRESVLDILLNLKQIIFLSNSNFGNPEIGFLKIQGPAIVHSRDLKLPTHLKCVDPNQYIATLSSNTSLEMKFMICKGKNFVIQTSFAVISETFHSHFYNNQKQNIMLLTKQKSTGLVGQNFTDAQVEKTRQVPNFSVNSTSGNFTKNKNVKDKQEKSNSQSTNYKANDTLTTTYVPNRIASAKVSQASIFTKYFFKKVENNLLYSNLHISEVQIAKNMFLKKNLKQNSLTNVLLIDSVFMPVVKVNFSIKNINKFYKIKNRTLVNTFEKNVCQEKIFLEVWTNGSIDPKKAIYLASQQIIDIFSPLQKTCLTTKDKK